MENPPAGRNHLFFPLVLLQTKVVGLFKEGISCLLLMIILSISSPSNEGGGRKCTTTLTKLMLSISSPSNEGGGSSWLITLFEREVSLRFPLVLLQTKVVGCLCSAGDDGIRVFFPLVLLQTKVVGF